MKNDELKRVLLDRLFQYRQLSRQELLKLHPCRPASMLSAINELKAQAVLIEPERSSGKTGRRSPTLRFNPASGSFVGIELQVRRLFGVVLDGAENLLAKAELDFSGGITAASIPARLRELLKALKAQMPPDAPNWSAIGFADPGLVDLERQRPIRAHNIAGWKEVPLLDWLAELAPGTHGFVAPGTMCRAYAEYAERRPELPDTMFLFELDSGIGGSCIKGGRLLTGSTSRGMEIGHLVIHPGGPLCKCGNHGCLEAIAGEDGIRRRVEEIVAGNVRTELDLAGFSLSRFVELAKGRDRAAGLLAREVCDGIAPAVAIVVTLLNPELIVFSGRIAGLGDLLLDAVRRTLNVNCFYGAIEKLRLEISRLDDYAAATGVALMARRRELLPEEPLWW